MSQYYPPKYQKSNFHCLYCQTYAHQDWEDLCSESEYIDSQLGELGVVYVRGEKVEFSICAKCKQPTIWIEKKAVYPFTGSFPLANSDLPKKVMDLYEEASSIANQSPRAACALLRLAIELLLKELGETGTINEGIKNLVKKRIDVRVQKALDVVRVTGNNAVHPGEIVIDDNTDVQMLFNLINFIGEELITKPNRVDEMFNNLPEKDKKTIEKRDGKTP